ncbi:uncharacterized protein [Paramormyrops kingsleyae]|uniref:uncharacterized protein n=1 Tax=Paramormyrops kingsleyae TaxID=1676925 RepID=UPI003B970555
MTEYLLLILYFSSFICLCALVCLYFSGCQEMTYKHDGKGVPLHLPGLLSAKDSFFGKGSVRYTCFYSVNLKFSILNKALVLFH